MAFNAINAFSNNDWRGVLSDANVIDGEVVWSEMTGRGKGKWLVKSSSGIRCRISRVGGNGRGSRWLLISISFGSSHCNMMPNHCTQPIDRNSVITSVRPD